MSDWNDETDSAFTNHEADDWISKSQLKREAKALVAFAVELANELSKSQINQLPFAEETRRAIAEYSAIKANIARKRHAQAWVGLLNPGLGFAGSGAPCKAPITGVCTCWGV